MPISERRSDLVVLFSGGLDSTVLLCHLLAEGHRVEAVSFDYGQRHHRELDAAVGIARDLGVDHTIVEMQGLGRLSKRSAVSGDASVPHGRWDDESMRITVVPNRNLVLLGAAASLALDRGYNGVAFAAHGGDHTIYPDCRKEWVKAVQDVIRLGNWDAEDFEIHAPFLGMSKADIVIRGHEVNAPMRRTWSCYEGGLVHCGRCGTCVERRDAFATAGIVDGSEYAE